MAYVSGKSGSFSSAAYDSSVGKFTVKVSWTEKYDIDTNKSQISWKATYNNSAASSHPNAYVYIYGGTVTFNGTSFTLTAITSDKAKHGASLGSGTITVAHNADGTKSISASVDAKIVSTSGSYKGSSTIALTTIPRASTIKASATSLTVDGSNKVTFTITRASTSFTHKLTYKFGTMTSASEMVKNIATSYSWTPKKEALLTKFNASSCTCTITCITYNGSTQVGTSTCTITLNPTVNSLSVSSSTLVAGNSQTISINKSNSTFTSTITYAIGSKSGTIKTKTSDTSFTQTFGKSLIQYISNPAKGTVTLTCITYNGTYNIGTSTETFTLSIPASTVAITSGTYYAGSSIPWSVSSASTTLTHTLTYSFAGTSTKTGTIQTKSSTVSGSTVCVTKKDIATYLKTVPSAKLTITCTTFNGTAKIGTKTATTTVSIPPTTISATSVTMGNAVTITENKADSSIITKLSYKFGSKSGNLDTTSIPTSKNWASELTNELSKSGTVTCKTYTPDGNTFVKETTTNFTLTAALPTISFSGSEYMDSERTVTLDYSASTVSAKVTYELWKTNGTSATKTGELGTIAKGSDSGTFTNPNLSEYIPSQYTMSEDATSTSSPYHFRVKVVVSVGTKAMTPIYAFVNLTVPTYSLSSSLAKFTYSDTSEFASIFNTNSRYIKSVSIFTGKVGNKIGDVANSTYNSTIASIQWRCGENNDILQTGDASFTLATVSENINVYYWITDSRGVRLEVKSQIAVEDYVSPTGQLTTERVNNEGVSEDTGTFVKVSYNYTKSWLYKSAGTNPQNDTRTYVQVYNSSSKNWEIVISLSDITHPTTADTTISDREFSTSQSYKFRLITYDKIVSGGYVVLDSITVPVGFILLDFNANGKSIAIGKASEDINNDGKFEVRANTFIDSHTTGVDKWINARDTAVITTTFNKTVSGTRVYSVLSMDLQELTVTDADGSNPVIGSGRVNIGTVYGGTDIKDAILFSFDLDSDYATATNRSMRYYLHSTGEFTGYLKWSNILNKPTIYPTDWSNVASKPNLITPSTGVTMDIDVVPLTLTQSVDSNYTKLVQWYVDGHTYDSTNFPAQIGRHNTEDTDGAIIIVPQETPVEGVWSGNYGLYVGSHHLKYNGDTLYNSDVGNLYIKYNGGLVLLDSNGTMRSGIALKKNGDKDNYYAIAAAGITNYIQIGSNLYTEEMMLYSKGVWIGDNSTATDVYIRGSVQFTNTNDVLPTKDNRPPIIIGTKSGEHLELDRNEIQAKKSTTEVSNLYLQAGGGTLYIHSGLSTTDTSYGINVRGTTLSTKFIMSPDDGAHSYINTSYTIGTNWTSSSSTGQGFANLVIGNGTAVGTTAGTGEGNARGRIAIYNASTHYSWLYANSSLKSNPAIYLPASAGTLTVSSSDIRLKENIRDCEISGLDYINAIKLHQFEWKESKDHWDCGYIANELLDLDKHLILDGSGGETDNGDINPLCIDDFYLSAYQTKAIQELSAKSDIQETLISELKNRIIELEKHLIEREVIDDGK